MTTTYRRSGRRPATTRRPRCIRRGASGARGCALIRSIHLGDARPPGHRFAVEWPGDSESVMARAGATSCEARWRRRQRRREGCGLRASDEGEGGGGWRGGRRARPEREEGATNAQVRYVNSPATSCVRNLRSTSAGLPEGYGSSTRRTSRAGASSSLRRRMIRSQ